jgi:molybdopterin-guanine dinucleotide biosynthesis protein B
VVQKLRTKFFAVVGSKKSGKTTTIENLTRELTKRGYKVATVKHVSEKDFTIDTEGKDTWRFAKSGAKTIVTVASNEIATIEKVNPENFSLEQVLKKCKGKDVVFIEGLRSSVKQKRSIPKIVVVKSKEEVLEALKVFKPILVFTGPYSTESLNLGIPYIDALENSRKIAGIVEKELRKGQK